MPAKIDIWLLCRYCEWKNWPRMEPGKSYDATEKTTTAWEPTNGETMSQLMEEVAV